MSQFVPLAEWVAEVEIGKVQRCTGTIKWFDVAKRYGFVTLDLEPKVDAMLHVSCLQAIKADRVVKDAKVECDVERSQKGWVVKALINIEHAHDEPAPVDKRFVYAKVKWYNQARGFGFVTRGPNTPDAFVHAEVIGSQRLMNLKPNQEVLVLVEDGPKGPKVTDIRPIA